MEDQISKIQAEILSELEPEFKSAVEKHENEARRSFEISSSFYEKLAALNAGSLAIAVSIGIAIVSKPELKSSPLFQYSHWLIVIIICFWVSLVCAAIHNFIVVGIAKLDADYAEIEFVRTIIRRGLAIVKERSSIADQSQIDLLEEKAQEKPLREQQRNVKLKTRLKLLALFMGFTSMGVFLSAYTLVTVCAARLWNMTP